MQIPRGFEMMAQSIIKMMGLDPVKVMGAIDGMHQALLNVAADLRTIREDQKRIMSHLGLPMEGTENGLARTGTGFEVERQAGAERNTGTGN